MSKHEAYGQQVDASPEDNRHAAAGILSRDATTLLLDDVPSAALPEAFTLEG